MRRVVRTAIATLLWAAFACGQPASVRDFTILHLNDLHARLTPGGDGSGGFAYVATLLKRERAAAPASITLFAGDLVQGSPVSTMFEGVPIFEIANLFGFDVATLGNHEFDYGWRKIDAFRKAATLLFDHGHVGPTTGQG